MDKKITQPATEPVTSVRYDEKGHRRGRHKSAAILGGLITLTSLIGVVAIILGCVWWVRKASDTTALKDEFAYFLKPVLAFPSEPFNDITVTEDDAFLSAAVYRIVLAEQVRTAQEQQKNGGIDVFPDYPIDELGRIVVPLSEVEASYHALFGPDAPLSHRSIDSSIESNSITYSEAEQCYYVPYTQQLATGYEPVIDSIKRTGSTYIVRVGFVAQSDITIDNYGNQVPPTAEQASYFQTYTFARPDKDTYYIIACSHE